MDSNDEKNKSINSSPSVIIHIAQIAERFGAATTLLGLLLAAISSIVKGANYNGSNFISILNLIGLAVIIIGLFIGLISSEIVHIKLSRSKDT